MTLPTSRLTKLFLAPAAIVLASLITAPPAIAQTETTPTTAPAADLPSAEKIIAKYIKTVGGEEKLRANTSMMLKGTLSMPSQGMQGALMIQQKAPNRFLLTMDIPGMGKMKQGYDGKVGWAVNPMMGPMLIEDEMLEQLAIESEFYRDLNYDKLYKEVAVVEKTDFEGTEAYKVKLVTPGGAEAFEYFGVESHLKIGGSSATETPMGTVETTMQYQDYKEVNGIMVPMKLTIEQMGMQQLLVVDEVSFEAIDDEVFALPAEIKTLVDARKAQEVKPETGGGSDDGAEG